MLKAALRILFIALISLNIVEVSASDNTRLTIDNKVTNFEYYNNSERVYSINQIRQLKPEQWISSQNFNPYGLVNQHYWLHIKTQLTQSKSEPLYLEISNSLIDKIEVHIYRGVQSRHYIAGDTQQSNSRPIETPILYFPLPSNQTNTVDIYIEYQDEAASFLPLAITNSKESFETINIHGIYTGTIIGLIIVLLLTTLMLYQEQKSALLQYYFGFLIFGGLAILTLEGLASVYLWPSLPWLQNLITPSLFLLTLWCSIELTKALIDRNITKYPVIEKSLTWLANIVIIIAPVLFALPTFIAGITSVIILCISLIIISSALISFTIKSKIVQPLLLATWSAFIVSLTLKTIHFSGIVALSDSVIAMSTLIYSLQFILWSTIILRRYILNKESTALQNNELIIELQEKNKEVDEQLTQTQQDHLDLEAVINERTFELNVTLRELQETNRQLQEQATNDALTGVKNRKFFDQRLIAEYRLSRRQHTPISLLLLDADKFKLINDNYGHLAGDKVLIEICNIASRILKRPNDFVCRYGGEEFAILLSNTDEKGAIKVADNIRQRIQDTSIHTPNEILQVTVSIGVSTLMVDKETPDTQLFEQADKALYYAKESGRNNVKSYNEFKSSNK